MSSTVEQIWCAAAKMRQWESNEKSKPQHERTFLFTALQDHSQYKLVYDLTQTANEDMLLLAFHEQTTDKEGCVFLPKRGWDNNPLTLCKTTARNSHLDKDGGQWTDIIQQGVNKNGNGGFWFRDKHPTVDKLSGEIFVPFALVPTLMTQALRLGLEFPRNIVRRMDSRPALQQTLWQPRSQPADIP